MCRNRREHPGQLFGFGSGDTAFVLLVFRNVALRYADSLSKLTIVSEIKSVFKGEINALKVYLFLQAVLYAKADAYQCGEVYYSGA